MIDLAILMLKNFPASPSFSVVKIGGDFIHTHISDELCEFVALPKEKMVNHSLYDFFPKPYADQKTEFYERAWAGETIVTLIEPGQTDGYLLKVSPIYKDEKVVEIVGYACPVPSEMFAIA
jgi:hypothetical protein